MNLATALPAIVTAFMAGILGSGHCFGMCGGIAGGFGAISGAARNEAKLIPSLVFNLGRLCSYMLLGAIVALLLGSSGEQITAETIDPVMYEQFLEARFLMRRRSDDAIQKAIDRLEPVVKAEPRFARGLIMLAEAYLLSSGSMDEATTTRRTDNAKSLAEAALAINPGLAGGFMILGWLADEPLAQYENLRRAVELDLDEPRPHHWLARQLSFSGHLDEALEQINEAVRLEPTNANAHGWRSTVLAATGNLDAAVKDALLQAELGNPTVGHPQAALYHIMGNDFSAAEDEMKKAINAGFAGKEIFPVMIAALYGEEKERERLASLLERGTQFEYFLLVEMLALNMHDEYLGHQLAAEEPSVGPTVVWHSNQRAMRADPRFVELVEKSKLNDLWREIGPPPDCRVNGDSFVCGLGGSN